MTLAFTRAASFTATAIGFAALVGSSVAQAQAPAQTAPATEAPVSAPPPTPAPAEVGVPVAPPPAAAAPAETPTPVPAPEATPPVAAPAAPPAQPSQPAPPSGTGFDWGGRSVQPLPPPPGPADPRRIKRDPWRGRFWLSPRLSITGPIGGDKPARPSLLTLGGGADFGVRLSNRFGLGMGISGQTHQSARLTVPGTTDRTIKYGGALFWDALFLRVYFLKKRFQPLIEIGGGLARINMPQGGRLLGPQLRAGVGFDGWVSSNVTIGFTTVYRLIAVKVPADGIVPAKWVAGHGLQGVLQLGLHW